MSFASEGFLWPGLSEWITKHRSENPLHFELADRFNRVCLRALTACSVPDSDNLRLVVSLLFARALSSFQGGLLMVERGMSTEALTLARSCLESSFYLAATVRNPACIDRMISSDTKHKRGTIRWLKSPAAAIAEFPPEQVHELINQLERAAPSEEEPLQIWWAAEQAEMSEIYETFYRDLCNRAAHPSLSSLQRHMTRNADNEIDGLSFAPEKTETRNIILGLITALHPAVDGAGKVFPMTDECSRELNACWETYVQLNRAPDAAS